MGDNSGSRIPQLSGTKIPKPRCPGVPDGRMSPSFRAPSPRPSRLARPSRSPSPYPNRVPADGRQSPVGETHTRIPRQDQARTPRQEQPRTPQVNKRAVSGTRKSDSENKNIVTRKSWDKVARTPKIEDVPSMELDKDQCVANGNVITDCNGDLNGNKLLLNGNNGLSNQNKSGSNTKDSDESSEKRTLTSKIYKPQPLKQVENLKSDSGRALIVDEGPEPGSPEDALGSRLSPHRDTRFSFRREHSGERPPEDPGGGGEDIASVSDIPPNMPLLLGEGEDNGHLSLPPPPHANGYMSSEEAAFLNHCYDTRDYIAQYADIIEQENHHMDSSGQEVQRVSVITTLPELLEGNNAECMRRVVPKIREVLHVAQSEMQVAACSAFLQILQRQLVPLPNYTTTFLQTILTSLDNRDPDIAGAWLDTLLDVIDLLPKDVIKKDILSIAIAKGQLSQSVQSRLSCCRILGKIATKFEPFVIKKDILPIVQSLCQDVDYEVRGCMCRQLDAVARGLGLEQTKSAILPELVELTNDEESYVRLAGLETVVNILTLLDDETCMTTIVTLVCKFCQQALANKDPTLPTVARLLGKLVHGLQAYFTDEQKKWFIDYYKKLCRLGDSESKKQKDNDLSSPKQLQPAYMMSSLLYGLENGEEEADDEAAECRKNAGYNFPAMVLFAGGRQFKAELLTTLGILCEDSNPRVRKTVAHGLHEVAKLLGSNVHLILPDLIRLLQDDSTEVLAGVVAHLPATLELLAKLINNSTDKQQNAFLDVIPAMLACETVISSSNNWRLQETFISQLSCIHTCFPSSHIYSKFIPLLFRKLHTARAHPVKHAACKSLVILMRHNNRLEQRREMCYRITDELCHGRSYFQRILYIDICRLVLEHYSRAFFKEHFFDSLLELCTDKVPNVRLRLCPLLPRLKAVLRLPAERTRLQTLETCVRKLLSSETDHDVRASLEKSVMELDRVQVQMESKKGCVEEDLADQKKEEEEKMLIEIEEKEKEEEIKSAKSDRKSKDASCKKSDSKLPGPTKSRSKIPAATSVGGKEKISRSERSGSFGSSASSTTSTTSSVSGKDVNRSASLNSKSGKARTPGLKDGPNSVGSPTLGANSSLRRGSASSQSSASSASTVSSTGSSVKARRSSLGTLLPPLPEARKQVARQGSSGNLQPPITAGPKKK